MKKYSLVAFLVFLLFIINCNPKNESENVSIPSQKKIDEYAIVTLKNDLSNFKESDKKMLKYLIEASEIIDSIFWYENIGFLDTNFLTFKNEISEKLFELNFGPWNRLEGNNPFIENIDAKPAGAYFYPPDITTDEFEKFDDSLKLCHYTFIRRDSSGNLKVIPYNIELQNFVSSISKKLLLAAEQTDNPDFKNYLKLKSEALLTDNYYNSDTAWLNIKNNYIDFVIGPIDIYNDKFYNCKADHLAFLLLKDTIWSKKIQKYTLWLPFLQKALPVPEQYRSEEPGESSDINIYEVLYIAGSAKTGGAIISQILPLDEKTQVEKGTRNLQFKNIINAKFEAILYPISQIIFDKNQKKQVNSDAFFANVLFTEMAKSLGIKQTINNKGLVRDALKDSYTVTDIVKSCVLSLFLIEKLHEVGEIQNDLSANYTTFIANTLRVIRLGASSDYAKSYLICFNYLVEMNAIKFNDDNSITLDYEIMKSSLEELSKKVIIMEGDGNYLEASEFILKYNKIDENLQKLLDKIDEKDIPKDIAFEQGLQNLGL